MSISQDRVRAREEVLQAIPRRKRVNAQPAGTALMPRRRPPKVSFWTFVFRLFLLGGHGIRFILTGFGDWLRGKRDMATRARRIRETLERLGATTIKLGQQLSVRADMLPQEVCDELVQMLDRVSPFPFEHAANTIEETIGGPLNKVFKRLDPEPIGSASIACVYQGELLSGDRVAVKVKRPRIAEDMGTDLAVIRFLCQVSEVLSIIRPGLTKNLIIEADRMLREELDFELEARYTEIFRRDARDVAYVSAPRVYHEFSGKDVIVSEFVSGAFMSEILGAVAANDQSALNELYERGFRIKRIARRLQYVFYWECFESNFFHADPHPANIIVKPDNTIVMIDFGSCGSISTPIRRKLLAFNRQLAEQDLHGMVQTTISMLEPLPRFDVDDYSMEMLNIYREIFVALQSRHAPWYDKCTGGAWMKLILLNQRYQLPMTLDTLRIFRANFMYDSVVFRLDPKLRPAKLFSRWMRDFDQKKKNRALREIGRRIFGPLASDFREADELGYVLRASLDRIRNMLDQPNYSFVFSIDKVSYFTSVAVQGVLTVGSVFVTLVGLRQGIIWFSGATDVSALDTVNWATSHPVFIFSVILVFIINTRKVLFKLGDVDTK